MTKKFKIAWKNQKTGKTGVGRIAHSRKESEFLAKKLAKAFKQISYWSVPCN